MTTQEKLIELAKMDGWKMHDHYDYVMVKKEHEAHILSANILQYLTSYDCIIPLIQKQGEETQRLLARCLHCSAYRIPITATPSQLADALLAAKGFNP